MKRKAPIATSARKRRMRQRRHLKMGLDSVSTRDHTASHEKLSNFPSRALQPLAHEGGRSSRSDDKSIDSLFLRQAAKRGDLNGLKLLLARLGLDLIQHVDENDRTLLSYAAEKGHTNIVSYLVNEWARWSERKWPSFDNLPEPPTGLGGGESWHRKRDKWGRTPLSWSAANGHLDAVQLLLEQDTQCIAIVDKTGQTPLELAYKNGFFSIHTSLLASLSGNTHQVSTSGSSGLSWMELHGNEKGLLSILILDTDRDFARTLISHRVTIAQSSVLRGHVNFENWPPDRPEILGIVLSVAAEQGWSELVGRALSLDEEPWKPWGESPSSMATSAATSAILLALNNCHYSTVMVMLDDCQRQLVQKIRRPGGLGLAHAWWHHVLKPIFSDGWPLIETLRSKGPFVGNDELAQQLLHIVSLDGEFCVLELLLRSRVDPDRKDEYGRTPLCTAAAQGNIRIFKLLLQQSSNPDHKDNYGRTALSRAAEFGGIEVVQNLLAIGEVDPTSKDDNARTPLHWATMNGHIDIVKTLLGVYDERNLDWEPADSKGHTPLDAAMTTFQNCPCRRCESVLEPFFELDARFPLLIPLCRYCQRLLSLSRGLVRCCGRRVRPLQRRWLQPVKECAPWRLMETASQRCELCQFALQQARIILERQSSIGARVQFVMNQYNSFKIQVIVAEPPRDRNLCSATSLAFYRPKGKIDDKTRLHYHGNPTTTFEDTVDVIKAWLDACTGHCQVESTHKGCPSGDRKFPKRLLKLYFANPKQVQLIECPEGRQGKYAALSHCWGDPRHMERVKTTKRNYKDRLRSVLYDDLPTSFKDAVRVCQKLQIRYLWIDSLCIVQDDSRDWQHESTKMTTTYENAFITLAATASPGCTEGFTFSHPRPRRFSEFSVSPGADLDQLKKQPLYKRGWTLQEMVLSRRVVHFASDQLYWFCRSANKSQHGQDLGPGSALSHLKSASTALGHKIWWDWVEDYSSRQLTKAEDKLPALAGLTKKFQQLTGDTPALGLWMEDIHSGLLWQPVRTSEGSQPWAGETDGYIPSWSWASFRGSITRPPRLDASRTAKAIIRQNSLELCWAGEELTSGVLVGSLHVGGRLKKLDYGAYQESQGQDVSLLYDRGPPGPDLSDVWCLEILEVGHSYPTSHFLLVEHEVKDWSKRRFPMFKRIGTGCLRGVGWSNNWFADLPMEDVILV